MTCIGRIFTKEKHNFYRIIRNVTESSPKVDWHFTYFYVFTLMYSRLRIMTVDKAHCSSSEDFHPPSSDNSFTKMVFTEDIKKVLKAFFELGNLDDRKFLPCEIFAKTFE